MELVKGIYNFCFRREVPSAVPIQAGNGNTEDLTDDVLTRIFKELDFEALAKIPRVCHRWKKVSLLLLSPYHARYRVLKLMLELYKTDIRLPRPIPRPNGVSYSMTEAPRFMECMNYPHTEWVRELRKKVSIKSEWTGGLSMTKTERSVIYKANTIAQQLVTIPHDIQMANRLKEMVTYDIAHQMKLQEQYETEAAGDPSKFRIADFGLEVDQNTPYWKEILENHYAPLALYFQNEHTIDINLKLELTLSSEQPIENLMQVDRILSRYSFPHLKAFTLTLKLPEKMKAPYPAALDFFPLSEFFMNCRGLQSIKIENDLILLSPKALDQLTTFLQERDYKQAPISQVRLFTENGPITIEPSRNTHPTHS